MLPEHIPEFHTYNEVSKFVIGHLSMQFGDVRSMMRLPLPSLGITNACNFAATATLCNLISGMSVSLYMPAQPAKANKKGQKELIGSGEAFKSLATAFYPWPPGQNPKDGAKVL